MDSFIKYVLRAVAALVVGLFAWFMGNILFFGVIGIITLTGANNPANPVFGNIPAYLQFAWGLVPFSLLFGSGIYIIYGALSREPYKK